MINFLLKKYKNISYGINFYIFVLGLFFLPSAFTIGAILLLISLLRTTFINNKEFVLDRWSIFFLIASSFMVTSCIIHTFYNDYLYKYNLKSSLSWIGLGNWLPLIWCYTAFKPLLNNPEKRKISSIALLCGSLPLLFTGIGQYFFGWYGPFEFLNGFIVWYQRPIENHSGLTGLFNNANYMGAWLNIIWPIGIACLIDSSRNILNNISTYIFTLGISLSTIFTFSRAAWIGIFLGTLLMYGKRIYKYLIALIIVLSLVISSTVTPILGTGIQTFLKSFIPQSIWIEFSDFQYSRISIWKSGLNAIYNNPVFGSGAGSFQQIYIHETGLWKGHSHNLPIELMISYGIPAALLIIIPILIIVFISSRKILLKGNKVSIFDKSWITCLMVLLTSQMYDVQYFDGRISIILWLLLSGSTNIIKE